MKYLLLCALVIAGAFFSSTSIPAVPDEHMQCDPHEKKLIGYGCGLSVPARTCEITNIQTAFPLGNLQLTSIADLDSVVASNNRTYSPPNCIHESPGGTSQPFAVSETWSHQFVKTCPETAQEVITVDQPTTILKTTIRKTTTRLTGDACRINDHDVVNTEYTSALRVTYRLDGEPECPATHPLGPIMYNQAPLLGHFCYRLPPEPECDCANFAGQSLNTRNTLRAPKGQYTNENPPQCVMQQEFVAGRDTPLTCTCQVSAQKWMKTNSGFENGVEYERWETLPTTQGQPSGTFTGVKCGATDGGPLEPENNAPKECFTLPNGVRWCWADRAEKCQVVNGVEQCASGCGTVNGDFVCYDDKPVIPPKDRDQLTPPDDTLTDPNKPINEMVKSDFKEVNKGVETRLDNVVTSISNATIAMDEVSDKVGLTNSKLDGIGMQLDGVGKQLGAIDGKLEGAFGDKGQPMPGTGDGKNCHEEVCSWYESAYPDGLVGIWEERSLALQQTALFDFVNQFSFEPSGSQPEMQLCFNLASYANFGCFSLEIPAFVWVFLRVCILFSAAMLCRALIFGG